jgi:uncharacterized membrane protein YdjX (TVP38/TMEM64 family)
MSKYRTILIVVIAVLVTAFFAAGGHRYLSFDSIRGQQLEIQAYYAGHPWQTAIAFFVVYVAVTGLSLPGASIMTLVTGAIFGLLWGTVIVSFASSIGATLAFLASRFLLRDWVQQRFEQALRAINAGVQKEGGFYLFTLRLIPAIPFFAINLVMGLVPMRTWPFYWVSQCGMLAGTIVYVNAGTQLAAITSPAGILSPGLIGAFVLLGFFPLIAKRIVDAVKARRVYARWKDRKPAKFDRNLVVIGAGSAGLVTSYIAAAVKAKVTLVEKHRMGGDCLNTGCVPSKALIKTARVLATVRRAKDYGLQEASAEFDFADVMERVQRVVKTVEPHDSVERYTALGVECVEGTAKIVTPWEVEVQLASGGTRRLSTRSIAIATGARPFVPPIPGIADMGCLTSDTIWSLRKLPPRLVVLGGGPIGSELAQAFARWAQVTRSRCCRGCSARDPSSGTGARAGGEAWTSARAQGDAVPEGKGAGLRARREVRLVRCAALCRGRGEDQGLRARGARHPHRAAPWRRTSSCRRPIPTSTPAATWPGPTSSRTWARTRPGTPR